MGNEQEGFFIGCGRACFAGTHLFFELPGLKNLGFFEETSKILTATVKTAGISLQDVKCCRDSSASKNFQNSPIKKGQGR
jgi:hypothetical protein